jgi:hypothetical protein
MWFRIIYRGWFYIIKSHPWHICDNTRKIALLLYHTLQPPVFIDFIYRIFHCFLFRNFIISLKFLTYFSINFFLFMYICRYESWSSHIAVPLVVFFCCTLSVSDYSTLQKYANYSKYLGFILQIPVAIWAEICYIFKFMYLFYWYSLTSC